MKNDFISNSTDFPYKLNIHAAMMLIEGLDWYVRHIKRLYQTKQEQADYCDLMLWTARKEAHKLLRWLLRRSKRTHLVRLHLEGVKALLDDIEEFRLKLVP